LTRRFPPPWSVEEPDQKLDRRCFIVRDANGHALVYVYFEGEGERSMIRQRIRAGLRRASDRKATKSCRLRPALATMS
jgi:hypothetical protein